MNLDQEAGTNQMTNQLTALCISYLSAARIFWAVNPLGKSSEIDCVLLKAFQICSIKMSSILTAHQPSKTGQPICEGVVNLANQTRNMPSAAKVSKGMHESSERSDKKDDKMTAIIHLRRGAVKSTQGEAEFERKCWLGCRRSTEELFVFAIVSFVSFVSSVSFFTKPSNKALQWQHPLWFHWDFFASNQVGASRHNRHSPIPAVNQCWAWLSIGKAFSTSCWAASFRTCHARSQATAALDLCDADFSTHTSHFTQPLTSHLTRLSLSLSVAPSKRPSQKRGQGTWAKNSMNFVGVIGMIKVASSRCYITTYSDSRGYSLTQYVYIYIIVTHSMELQYNV